MKKEAGAKKKIAPRSIPRLMGLGNTKVTSKMDGAEGNLTIVPIEKGGRQEYSTGIRDPPRVEEVKDGSLLGGRLGQQAICCPDPKSKSSSSQRRQRGVESKPFFSTLSSITKWRVLL
uniref:Uncharacterized protein n=1 Tax=Solanum lycopersicum TaxID=4081 RepID=A0A3Q7HKK3_SOLLC